MVALLLISSLRTGLTDMFFCLMLQQNEDPDLNSFVL